MEQSVYRGDVGESELNRSDVDRIIRLADSAIIHGRRFWQVGDKGLAAI
jgi:hypothetical protein